MISYNIHAFYCHHCLACLCPSVYVPVCQLYKKLQWESNKKVIWKLILHLPLMFTKADAAVKILDESVPPAEIHSCKIVTNCHMMI